MRRPLFILKQQDVTTLPVITNGPEGAIYDCSTSRFITADIINSYMQTLSNDFLVERLRRRALPSEYRFPDVDLVFTDGHVSRFFMPMIERTALTNVTLLKFPSHLSQSVQPLDVIFFKVLKGSIRESVRLWIRQHPGETITTTDIP